MLTGVVRYFLAMLYIVDTFTGKVLDSLECEQDLDLARELARYHTLRDWWVFNDYTRNNKVYVTRMPPCASPPHDVGMIPSRLILDALPAFDHVNMWDALSVRLSLVPGDCSLYLNNLRLFMRQRGYA